MVLLTQYNPLHLPPSMSPSGASPVGLVLTAIVAVVYKVAIRFEG